MDIAEAERAPWPLVQGDQPGESIRSFGWYTAAPGQCVTTINFFRPQEEYYFFAKSFDGTILRFKPTEFLSQMEFCIDMQSKFEYDTATQPEAPSNIQSGGTCPHTDYFVQLKIGAASDYTYNITENKN